MGVFEYDQFSKFAFTDVPSVMDPTAISLTNFLVAQICIKVKTNDGKRSLDKKTKFYKK